MPMKLFLQCLGMLLIMQTPAIAVDHVIESIDIQRWPLLTIEYKRPISPLDDVSITLPEIDRKIQAKKIQKIHETKQQNLLIAIDTSRSLTQEYLSSINFAIKDYIKHINENHTIAILSFNDSIQLNSPFTKDKKQLIDSLEIIKQGGGKTELYGTIDSAITLIQPQEGVKSLLIISDGHDEGKPQDTSAIIKKAIKSDVMINFIGLPDKGAKNEPFLNIVKKISEDTKGSYEYCSSPLSISSAIISILRKHNKDSIDRYRFFFDLADIPFQKAGDTECVLEEVSGNTTKTFRFSISVPKTAVKLLSLGRGYLYAAIVVGVSLLVFLCLLFRRRNRSEPESQLVTSTKNESSGFIIEFYGIGMTFPLPYGRVTIGASKDNSIILEDPTVSRHHAVLEILKNECKIEDLKSTNGIYVNEARISRPVYLKPGDKLYFGKAEAVFRQIALANK